MWGKRRMAWRAPVHYAWASSQGWVPVHYGQTVWGGYWYTLSTASPGVGVDDFQQGLAAQGAGPSSRSRTACLLTVYQ